MLGRAGIVRCRENGRAPPLLPTAHAPHSASSHARAPGAAQVTKTSRGGGDRFFGSFPIVSIGDDSFGGSRLGEPCTGTRNYARIAKAVEAMPRFDELCVAAAHGDTELRRLLTSQDQLLSMLMNWVLGTNSTCARLLPTRQRLGCVGSSRVLLRVRPLRPRSAVRCCGAMRLTLYVLFLFLFLVLVLRRIASSRAVGRRTNLCSPRARRKRSVRFRR